MRELLAPRGQVVIEVEPPGSRCLTQRVRLESSSGTGAWFPWAWLSADCVESVAAACDLRLVESWQDHGRAFAELRRG